LDPPTYAAQVAEESFIDASPPRRAAHGGPPWPHRTSARRTPATPTPS
jgi:hypothetical protein